MPDFIGTGYHRFIDFNGYPAISPPWGTLNAIDLNVGKIVWSVPLGEFPNCLQRGFHKPERRTMAGRLLLMAALFLSVLPRMKSSGSSMPKQER